MLSNLTTNEVLLILLAIWSIGFWVSGWVARDKDTEMLNFYMDRPPRRYDFWAAPASLHLPDKGFPDLKWEDEPMEVEMIITKKKC